jgi:hypothetical protein
MTLRKTTGRKFKLCCDEPKCKSVYGAPFYMTELRGAVSSARMHGWHVLKTEAGNWRHYCPAHDEGKGGGRGAPPPLPEPAAPNPRFYWNDN